MIELGSVFWDTNEGKRIYSWKPADKGKVSTDYESKVLDDPSKTFYNKTSETERILKMTMKVTHCDSTKYKCLLYDADLTEGRDIKELKVKPVHPKPQLYWNGEFILIKKTVGILECLKSLVFLHPGSM